MKKKTTTTKTKTNTDTQSYAKIYKDQKKKSNISNNKQEAKLNTTNNINMNNKEKTNQSKIIKNSKIISQEPKIESKKNTGINFDNLNDWGNIVYPNEQNINECINKFHNKEQNNEIDKNDRENINTNNINENIF